MRKTLIILAFGVIYLICSSRSCNEENSTDARERAQMAAARDSVLQAFGNERLNDSEQYAYELVAVQKLKDMPHYLRILTDPGAENIFREKAAEMLRAMFISGESRLELILPGQQDSVDLSSFLEDALHGQYPAFAPEFANIRKAEALRQINDTLYSGMLQFTSTRKAHKHPGAISEKDQTLLVTMHAVRMDKAFGSEKIRVWKVVLGDVME